MFIKEYYHIKDKMVPVIRGGKGGCFGAGTVVKTFYGNTNIEDIKVGDAVLTFNSKGQQEYKNVTHIHKHNAQETLKVVFWNGELVVTPNHWFLTDDNEFKEIGHFKPGDALVSQSGNIIPIVDIFPWTPQDVYNLTVADNNTYYANKISVHNKGGGKNSSPPIESENTLFSTDILVVLLGIGEGPVYRINPNGPQDIEINDGSIDDLLNIDGDGGINTDNFYYASSTGTLTQEPLLGFGQQSVSPQSLASAVSLKKGNIAGVPRSIVNLQNTSAGTPWDRLRFHFTINGLQEMDDKGNINPASVSIAISLFDHTGTVSILPKVEKTINGKQVVAYKFNVEIAIPQKFKSDRGYRFTIEKTSDEKDTAKYQDTIMFTGWDEILETSRAYPRTALYGIALKAAAEYTGGVPTFTSMCKGLLCKVPSNYNQPILKNGEIDWRHLEVSNTGADGYPTRGYYLQSSTVNIQYEENPEIYKGLWDGSFVWAWTQNPVWIVYNLLTNPVTGLGIPEEYIEKYKFYRVAQYCDAVDFNTGRWTGVEGTSCGSYINRPLGYYDNDSQAIRKVLLGLPPGLPIKERRFTCDIIISSQKPVVDVITQITSLFRGVLFYSAGKITLNVDMPEDIPTAVFSEATIKKDSMVLSGVKESELVTGVEVTYIEPMNHYKREIVRVTDPQLLREARYVENVVQIDLPGCSRRSQAIRFAQYILANSKYIRRKVNFSVNNMALSCAVGDVISVAQRQVGTAWGYAGVVQSNGSIGLDIVLEHYTSPAIPTTFFTNNTKPAVLRVLHKDSDRVDLFQLSPSIPAFDFTNTGNVVEGFDQITVHVKKMYDYNRKVFRNLPAFPANAEPKSGDFWTLGYGDDNIYNSTSDKLFKITSIDRSDEEIKIGASEYVSNVYIDSDVLINYTPVPYLDTYSPLVPPPAPLLDVILRTARNDDGSIRYDLQVDSTTDRTSYPLTLSTQYEIAYPNQVIDIIG